MIPIKYAFVSTFIYFDVILIFTILFGLLTYKVGEHPMSNQNAIIVMVFLILMHVTPNEKLYDKLLLFKV